MSAACAVAQWKTAIVWIVLPVYLLARITQLWAERLPPLFIVVLHVVPPALFAVVHGSIVYGRKGILVFTAFCLGFGAFFESLSLRTGFPSATTISRASWGQRSLAFPFFLCSLIWELDIAPGYWLSSLWLAAKKMAAHGALSQPQPWPLSSCSPGTSRWIPSGPLSITLGYGLMAALTSVSPSATSSAGSSLLPDLPGIRTLLPGSTSASICKPARILASANAYVHNMRRRKSTDSSLPYNSSHLCRCRRQRVVYGIHPLRLQICVGLRHGTDGLTGMVPLEKG